MSWSAARTLWKCLAGLRPCLVREMASGLILTMEESGWASRHLAAPEYCRQAAVAPVLENKSPTGTRHEANRPLEEWGKLLGDATSASAILDRFLHHAQTIVIRGKSYRLRNQAALPKPTAGGRGENNAALVPETKK